MIEQPISFSNGRGDRLAGILHLPASVESRAAVLLCHGMDSHKESEKLARLGRQFAQRGIAALRFDFSYVGESSGKYEELTCTGEAADLAAAHDLLKSRGFERIALFGSSLGGTVALLFAAHGPSLKAIATLAAPLHPERFPERLLPAQEIVEWRTRGYGVYNGRRLNTSLFDDFATLDMPKQVKEIFCPVLTLHGDRDEIVPVAEAYELHDCLPALKKLTILTGADHRLSNPADMDRAINETLEWLTVHVS